MGELIMQIEASAGNLPAGPPSLEIHRLDGDAEATRLSWPTCRCCECLPAALG
jgi:hypothetical protein